MAFLDCLLVVLVELCCFLMTSGFPVDLLCQGRTQNGQIHYKVSPNITDVNHDCEAQWLVNETLMALCDGKVNASFMSPIQHATMNTAIMEVGSASDKVVYNLICNKINVHRRLTCFLSAYPTTHAPLTKNETFAGLTEEGYPNWWIGVTVAAVIMLLVVIALVYKNLKNRSDYVLADKK